MGRGWTANIAAMVVTLVAGLTVILRLFTRIVLLRNPGYEDVWSLIAMGTSIGLTVTVSLQIKNGLGRHIFELTDEQKMGSMKAFWMSIWMYSLSLTATKLSILIQFLRIFPNQRFRLFCFVSIGIVTTWGAWTAVGSIYICVPIKFFWDKSIIGGRCFDQNTEFFLFFLTAGINIFQDIVLLIMPIPFLRILRIPQRQKRALILVFLVGGAVCIASIVRLRFVVVMSSSNDPIYDNVNPAMLSTIEINVGIICSCLPSMRPLLSASMPSYFPNRHARPSVRQTPDEERIKNLQKLTMARISCPERAKSRGQHSRPSSNSLPYAPGYGSESACNTGAGSSPSSRTQSTSGSQADKITIFRQPSDLDSHTRTSHQSSTHKQTHNNTSNRAPPRNGPTQLETYYEGPSEIDQSRTSIQSRHQYPSQSHSNSSIQSRSHSYIRHPSQSEYSCISTMLTSPQQSSHGSISRPSSAAASAHHQHQLHPLRLSPHSTSAPRLAQLPEYMSNFDPFQRESTSPSAPSLTSSHLVFHKPLPVTPYPIPTSKPPVQQRQNCSQCATGICTLHLVVQTTPRYPGVKKL